MHDVTRLLRDLVAFPTISSASNLDLVEWSAAYLRSFGIAVSILPNKEGSKAALLASIGPAVPGGIVLSGHTDVVPADVTEWAGDPFLLREHSGRLHGRGAVDMKGFIALVLDAVPDLASRRLRTPIHIALSYDEELGCLGLDGLLEAIRTVLPRPAIALVGEPTRMQVVNAHKGYLSFRTDIAGESAHSGNPARGISSIKLAGAVITALGEIEKLMCSSASSGQAFSPPYTTMNIGTIRGGTAVNIVPAATTIEWKARPVPGQSAVDLCSLFDEILDRHLPPGRDGRSLRHMIVTQLVAEEPILDPGGDDRAARLAMSLSGEKECVSCPFGTEAGFFQNIGLSAAVVGPGDPAQAHRPDEYVSLEQLAKGQQFLRNLGNWAEQNVVDDV